MAAIIDALHDAAADTECDVDVTTEKLFTGYRVKSTSPALIAAETALRTCGYEPARIHTGGGSDANALEAAGVHCVNLANGTERNHEPTERVSVIGARGHARRHVRPAGQLLTLRRGTVVAAGDLDGPMQELEVDLGGTRRPALADVALVGPAEDRRRRSRQRGRGRPRSAPAATTSCTST